MHNTRSVLISPELYKLTRKMSRLKFRGKLLTATSFALRLGFSEIHQGRLYEFKPKTGKSKAIDIPTSFDLEIEKLSKDMDRVEFVIVSLALATGVNLLLQEGTSIDQDEERPTFRRNLEKHTTAAKEPKPMPQPVEPLPVAITETVTSTTATADQAPAETSPSTASTIASNESKRIAIAQTSPPPLAAQPKSHEPISTKMLHEYRCGHKGCRDVVSVPHEIHAQLKQAMIHKGINRPKCVRHGGYRHLLTPLARSA